MFLIHHFTSRLQFVFVKFRKPYYLNNYIGPIFNLPLADCMSFSCKLKTLGSGNSYDLRAQLKMSMHGDENTGEAGSGINEGSKENSVSFSPELVDERIKANFEPLHAQISAFAEMMDSLIQSNSTTKSTAASFRGPIHHHESPHSAGPTSSKFPTVAPLTTAGYLPDSYWILPCFLQKNSVCSLLFNFWSMRLERDGLLVLSWSFGTEIASSTSVIRRISTTTKKKLLKFSTKFSSKVVSFISQVPIVFERLSTG